MKVFVSWSGSVSHEVAAALKDWLPNVIQVVDVFFSTEDIAKGSTWFHELSQQIDKAAFAILCLTPENQSAPWVLFEAGALGKHFEQARVVPLLIGLGAADLKGPLAQLNAAQVSRDEIFRLLVAVNAALGDGALSERQLRTAFEYNWPRLESALASAVAKAKAGGGKYRYDVFLSTPMAAYANDDEYKAGRVQYAQLFDALRNGCGLAVYWAAEKIESMADFDALDVSALDDLKALDESRHFMLVYPQKLATSALFEAGYALALGRFCHYFVRERDDLPFLMRELAGSSDNVRIHTKADWKDYADLARKLVKHQAKWFAQV